MRARTIVCVGLALGCTGLRGDRWTETVDLLAVSTPPEIVVENSLARITCPMEQALAFSEAPVPLTPRQREEAEKRPKKWADFWRDYAASLQQWSRSGSLRRRPDEIKDLLHAGICGIVDRRTNEPQKEILVIVEHNPERRGGGGSREFRFMDGTVFLGVIDWMP
jgi:hypothetical protein